MSDVLVVPHSEAAAERAQTLFEGCTDARIAPAGASVRTLAAAMLRHRPGVVYVVDVASTTTAAAMLGALLRVPVVVDTGDVVYELLRATGRRSGARLFVVRVAEALTLGLARHVVVRGRAHADLLPRKATTFAPDLAPPFARPAAGTAVRARLGLDGAFVVGIVGSIHRAPAMAVTYGWDVVEALREAPEEVAALVVGDGDGRPELERRARELGVAERCRFVGRIPTPDISEWIGAMDAAVSTQTANAVGRVRTTGKLPLYLACGCPVLASDVGEAHELLAPLGWTIPYEGVVDRGYPSRLAGRLREWSSDGATEQRRRQALELHRRAFDADEVRNRVWQVVRSAGRAG